MERVRLVLKVLTYAALIAAAVMTVLTVANPVLVFWVFGFAFAAYVLFLTDLRIHPVETDVVQARRSMGRNLQRDWDTERRDVDRQVDMERSGVTVGLNLRGPQTLFKRSKWARRRE